MPFRWTINPYRGCTHACMYCFARPTHTYLDFDAGRDFEREIVVKVNAPEVLRAELARPSWKGEHVALGTNTDPYQWVEGRYKLMRGIWEAMRDARNPCSILTKSPLLLRDLELMQEIAERTEFSAAPVGPDARREGVAGDRAAHAEPAGAAGGGRRAQPGGHPDRRPDRAADARDQRRSRSRWSRSCELAAEAGAAYVTGIALHLRGEVRGCSSSGLRSTGPTWCRATRSSTAAARTRRRTSGGGWRGWWTVRIDASRAPDARQRSGRSRHPSRSRRVLDQEQAILSRPAVVEFPPRPRGSDTQRADGPPGECQGND